MNESKAIAEAKSAEVVNAEANASQAREEARRAQIELMKVDTTKALADALREVFGEHTNSGRFVDVTRIPLICKSIIDMNQGIQDIKTTLAQTKRDLDEKDEKYEKRYVNQDQFGPVQKLAYGLVTLILTTVVVALLGLVVMKGGKI